MARRNYRSHKSAQRHTSNNKRARTMRRSRSRMRQMEASVPTLHLRGRLAQLDPRVLRPRLAMPRMAMPTLDDGWSSGWHSSKLLSGFVLIAIIALLSWIQSDERWFIYPDSAEFTGATYLNETELFAMTGANSWNIFWLRPIDLEENLLQHPYIAEADVQIALPNRLIASVQEPTPVAVWMTAEGPLWVLDDGAVLEIRIPPGMTLEEQMADTSGRNLPVLVDMQREATSVERLDLAVDRAILDSTLALLGRLPDISRLAYNSGFGINFALPDTPYWVYWGDGTNLDDKLVRLRMTQEMLESGELQGQVIDVRYDDRLIVR